jgi:hypothetical protein
MEMAFATLVAAGLGGERFALLDIGCSGGLDPRWRVFGERLKALGVDASAAECARLTVAESSAGIEYVAAFAAEAADAKLEVKQASPLIFKIRDRLSFMRTTELREARLDKAATEEKLRHNAWELTELADRTRPVVVPELLAARGWNDLDYLKIDIDGSDFRVLRTFDGKFAALGVLGVQLEVNFVGTDGPDEHAFHNTDRFMRKQGYELCRLDVRTYSSRALPARYVWPTPAETVSGRPFQGEAYYARDVDSPGLTPVKHAKLAAIFSLWGVPDLAAEVVVAHRAALAPLFAVDRGLDLLAAQQQPDRAAKLDYKSYLRSFDADDRWFYRREGNIALGERLTAAWAAFRRPRG